MTLTRTARQVRDRSARVFSVAAPRVPTPRCGGRSRGARQRPLDDRGDRQELEANLKLLTLQIREKEVGRVAPVLRGRARAR